MGILKYVFCLGLKNQGDRALKACSAPPGDVGGSALSHIAFITQHAVCPVPEVFSCAFICTEENTIILVSPVPLVIPVFLHSGEGGDEAVRCKESVSLSGGRCCEQRLEWIIMSVEMSVGDKQ